MVTIGMLGKRHRATKLKYALASNAALKHVRFFYFTPSDVNYEEKTIEGTYHNGTEWKKKTFHYPDYIYDRMLFRGKKKYAPLYEEFAHIPFNNEKPTGGSISKSQMYERIEGDGRFTDYIIPYVQVETVDDIVGQLHKYNRIICKENEGSLGLSVYSMEKKDDLYVIQIQKEQQTYDEAQFRQVLQQEIIDTKGSFVVQPFIRSVTNEGNPFDIRAHLMKNHRGEWAIARIYPRIGARSSVVSNLHLGGSTCDLKMFLNRHITLENPSAFQKQLETFAVSFAKAIEKQFDFHYSELGLDIAIDEQEKMWLFEANMNRINVQNLTLEAADLAISYGKHVVQQKEAPMHQEIDEASKLSQRILKKFFK